MAHLVRSDDDTAESTGVLDDGDRIHLLQTLIHDARPANVGESCTQRRSFNAFRCFSFNAYLEQNRANSKFTTKSVGVK